MTPRAMFSDPTRHVVEDQFKRVAWELYGCDAIREARAILAETEPTAGYDTDFRTVVEIRQGAFVGGHGLWAAERALAESLAAFIAEPIQ